jgi:large subunit ribosomal protein L5
MNRLKEKYQKEIVEKLAKDLETKNVFAIPRLEKIVVNMGVGNTLKNKEQLGQLKKDLMAITGQMPSDREARVSVASFSIRRGMIVGLKVTLRGERMYSFLDRLVSIVLPRLRDFRGVSKQSFDNAGNYTLGIVEHSVFPEIDITKTQPHGLEVTIVSSAKNKEEAYKLLNYLGMPFEKKTN